MRLLVLVLSCSRPPYDALHRAQYETWDSVSADGVETAYYFCDDLAGMPGQLRRALDGLREWDLLFRTNSSSYVDKWRLLDRADALPREGCYSGVDGDGFASGAGFFLSPDCAEILRRELPDRSEIPEDVLVGQIMRRHGVALLSGERYDYWLQRTLWEFRRQPPDDAGVRGAYHLRCKSDSADREKDVAAMREIHRIKVSL